MIFGKVSAAKTDLLPGPRRDCHGTDIFARGSGAQSAFQLRGPQSASAAAVVDAQLNDLNLNNKTPILQRFRRWTGGLMHGNLGKTIDGGSVNAEMGRRMGVSLRLLLI